MRCIRIAIDVIAKGVTFNFSLKGLFAKRPVFTYGK